MSRWLSSLAACLVLSCTPGATADYIVASRHALVKEDHVRAAATRLVLERGDTLMLASTTQRDGYYEVVLDVGDTGWVYRTFVRRFPGDPEPEDLEDHEPEASGGAQPGSGAAGASPWVYVCEPVSTGAASGFTVLRKDFFVIGYSDQRHDPLWVCYAIGPQIDLTAYPRKAFATDQDTISKITTANYNNSGFSRGHMAPRMAISSRFGNAGNDATFTMSNVCPQFQDFNDGQWGDLEEWIAGRKLTNRFVKGWADEFERVWVTVGPIFDQDRDALDCGVEVPNAFYCIVVDEDQGQPRAMAFIMEHEDQREGDTVQALCPIRDVEARTGLDFFSCLPDGAEDQLESTAAPGLWPLPENPH